MKTEEISKDPEKYRGHLIGRNMEDIDQKVEPYPFPSTKVLELDMEKRGVVLDDEKIKTADTKKLCPQCGADLTDTTHCPNCGTRPFEKKKED